MKRYFYKKPKDLLHYEHVSIELDPSCMIVIPKGKYTFRRFCEDCGWVWMEHDPKRRAWVNGFSDRRYLDDYDLIIRWPGDFHGFGRMCEWGTITQSGRISENFHRSEQYYWERSNNKKFEEEEEEYYRQYYTDEEPPATKPPYAIKYGPDKGVENE